MSLAADMSHARTMRAVIFDFFGTLTCAAQRGPAHAAVATRLGCDPTSFAAALDATFAERSVGALGGPLATLATLATRSGAPPPSVRLLHEAYAGRVAALRADVRLRPDAVAVLCALRKRGLRVGVISDCAAELPSIWPELAVAPLVDVRVLSIEQRRHKPDRQMYLAASNGLGVVPADCLYVGDGDSHELSGATAAGMATLRLAADDMSGHLVFSADDWAGPSVRTLTDVLDVVARGTRRSLAAA